MIPSVFTHKYLTFYFLRYNSYGIKWLLYVQIYWNEMDSDDLSQQGHLRFVHIFLEMKISVQLTSFIFMYIYFYIHTSHTHMPSRTPTYIHTHITIWEFLHLKTFSLNTGFSCTLTKRQRHRNRDIAQRLYESKISSMRWLNEIIQLHLLGQVKWILSFSYNELDALSLCV